MGDSAKAEPETQASTSPAGTGTSQHGTPADLSSGNERFSLTHLVGRPGKPVAGTGRGTPLLLSRHNVLTLQRTIGNAAVTRLIATRSHPSTLRHAQVQRDIPDATPGTENAAAVRQALLQHEKVTQQAADGWKKLSLDDQTTLLNQLGQEKKLPVRLVDPSFLGQIVRPWLRQVPRGEQSTEAQRQALRALVEDLPLAEGKLIEEITAHRFSPLLFEAAQTNVLSQHYQGAVGKPWDAATLKPLYQVLDTLPPAHTTQNANLGKLTRFVPGGAKGIGGIYLGGIEVAIGVGSANDLQAHYVEGVARGDPLYNVHLFDVTVRHEIAHSVDKLLGNGGVPWSRSKNNAVAGNWKDYDNDYLSLLREMIASSQGPIASLPPLVKETATAWIVEAVSNGDDPTTRFSGDKGFETAFPNPDHRSKILRDPVLGEVHRTYEKSDPWGHGNGGGVVKSRVYFKGEGGTHWYSYDLAARSSDRKVSNYQFKSPQEWFAEVYAAYYEDGGGPEGGKKIRDPVVKEFFDTQVHTVKPSLSPMKTK